MRGPRPSYSFALLRAWGRAKSGPRVQIKASTVDCWLARLSRAHPRPMSSALASVAWVVPLQANPAISHIVFHLWDWEV